MIFEGDYVTHLVMKWQECHNSVYMEDILLQSQKLVEAIVSKYDQVYREDLIQESLLKLQYACDFYQPTISSLHNFFTTVIHNVCTTYVLKQEREYLIDDNAEDQYDSDVNTLPEQTVTYTYDSSSGLLTELTCYLRTRFKSIPATLLDECADIIYYGLRNTDNARIMLADITAIVMSRHVASLIFNAAVIFLRNNNLSCAEVNIDDVPELSLLHELRMVVGDIAYSKILVAFAGITLHIPQ